MKHRAPQFDLPGTADVFNLAAEIIRQEPPAAPVAKPDATPALFGPCPMFRPYRRDDGTFTRRCADCGALESEHTRTIECPRCKHRFDSDQCNSRPELIAPPELGPYIECPKCSEEFTAPKL